MLLVSSHNGVTVTQASFKPLYLSSAWYFQLANAADGDDMSTYAILDSHNDCPLPGDWHYSVLVCSVTHSIAIQQFQCHIMKHNTNACHKPVKMPAPPITKRWYCPINRWNSRWMFTNNTEISWGRVWWGWMCWERILTNQNNGECEKVGGKENVMCRGGEKRVNKTQE